MELKTVYLSGDMNTDPDHKDRFLLAENFLNGIGYIVVNPTRYETTLNDFNHEQRMLIGYRLVEITDNIFMVSGWQKSKDAHAELTYAKSLGKNIMYQDYYAPFRKGKDYEESPEEFIGQSDS